MENDAYINAAKVLNVLQAFDKLLEKVDESIDESDERAIKSDLQINELLDQPANRRKEKVKELAAKCPANVKKPNFSCWGTISSVAKVVLENWIQLVYMVQNIAAIVKNNNYLHTTVATKLLKLMSSKADSRELVQQIERKS